MQSQYELRTDFIMVVIYRMVKMRKVGSLVLTCSKSLCMAGPVLPLLGHVCNDEIFGMF